jgi:hypothetical protein
MQTNPLEFLESFERELMNQGTWYWLGDKKTPGSKARILTAMQKMLKAGISEIDVKEIIIDLQVAGYVEHERQVKAKTGLSVREFMVQKLNDLGTINTVNSEQKIENEHSSAVIGAS